MKLVLLLLMILLTPPMPSPKTYVIPGATVIDDVSCSGPTHMVTHHLTANDPTPGRYRIAGIDAAPTVSLLTTVPGQAALDGDAVAWHPHSTADELWVIAGGMPGCPTAVAGVERVGRIWLPLALN